MANFLDVFAPCEPSNNPSRKRTGAIMSPQEKCAAVAVAGIKACLGYEPSAAAFTAREVFDKSPELTRHYRRANSIGDLLGHGPNGLWLHQSERGGYLRCQDNAALFILGACSDDYRSLRQRMKEGESAEVVLADAVLDDHTLDRLVEELGFKDAEELAHEISQLPPASELLPEQA